MEGNTNNNNEDIRSNINATSDQSLITIGTDGSSMEQDDDIQTSEPVTDRAEAMVDQTNQTVTRIVRTVENSSSSNMTRSRIIDMDSIPTSATVQLHITTNPQEPRIAPPSTDNGQQQSRPRRHIMISYNRATATTICQRIYDRLTVAGYHVWFDRENITDGSIIDAMGEAIDDAYVVLLCMNEGYSNSRYCPKEAKYAQERNVPLIPCMLEKDYQPRGGLGFIKSDLKHIEFHDDNKFEESFTELTRQLDIIGARSEIESDVDNNADFRVRFNTILREHMQTIENVHLRRRNLNETELRTVLERLIQEFSPETWQSFENDPSNVVDDRQTQDTENDRLLQHLFRTQQENYARIEQYLLERDERIAAFQRFQQRQAQAHWQFNSNEHLRSLVRIEENHREGQERYDRIERQLQQLTELIIDQQEQHARETEASANAQQQTSYLLKTAITAAVLLCTLLVLFKNR